jgi:hypothetical protein
MRTRRRTRHLLRIRMRMRMHRLLTAARQRKTE